MRPQTGAVSCHHELTLCTFLLCLILAAFIGTVTGCGTVVPKPISSTAASWDGTNQNSGFIGFTQTGTGIITAHARDRYNALIDHYGKRFLIPLKHDQGLIARLDPCQPRLITNDGGRTWQRFTPNPNEAVFEISPKCLADFITMNQWRRDDR